MSKRIVVDPITRIEGHLRVEADIENGKIVDAFSSGTMVRLLEEILQGLRSIFFRIYNNRKSSFYYNIFYFNPL